MSAWCTAAQVLEQLPERDTYVSGAADAAGYLSRKIEEATDEAKSYLGRYCALFTAWDTAPPDAVRNAVLAIAIYRIARRRARLLDDPDAGPYERDYERAIAWLREVSAGKAELAVDWPDREEHGGHVAVVAGAVRRATF